MSQDSQDSATKDEQAQVEKEKERSQRFLEIQQEQATRGTAQEARVARLFFFVSNRITRGKNNRITIGNTISS